MTPDQAALLGKAENSLKAARLLAEQRFYDFAASRAYYAMFYAAQSFLLRESASFSKHSAVIAAFGQRFVKTGHVPEHFHRYLIEGADIRNISDYDAHPALSREEVEEQMTRAEEFLSMARQWLKEPPSPPPSNDPGF